MNLKFNECLPSSNPLRMIVCESQEDRKFNAAHHYKVVAKESQIVLGEINFQEGPIKENGLNGVGEEELLHILIHRLEAFQASPYACKENADALDSVKHALNCLNERTKNRVKRGVEGTSEK